MSSNQPGLYLCLISVHGLIRGTTWNSAATPTPADRPSTWSSWRARWRPATTSTASTCSRAWWTTRRQPGLREPIEDLGNGARIVRIEAGPAGYLPKEQLWDHLDAFADNMLGFLREQARLPSLIHSHYADAGYVGTRLSAQLGVPLVHTGHSLGRVKRQRLLASGFKQEVIDERYNMDPAHQRRGGDPRRASLVVTSTTQEIEEQYGSTTTTSPSACR
jgi:sucrose-phosphate synthase